MDKGVVTNAEDLSRELDWFAEVLNARLKAYFNTEAEGAAFQLDEHPPPELGTSPYAAFVRTHDLKPGDRLLLILALTPHTRPQLLDILWTRNKATQRGFSEFGGWSASSHSGFIPTGETAAFIIAGDDLAGRFELLHSLTGETHPFVQHKVLELAPTLSTEPVLSGALTLSRDHLHRFTTGAQLNPAFSRDFPAQRIQTQLEWGHLVLPHTVLEQLEEIRYWIQYSDTLLNDWNMKHKLSPGFTSLFYGPPGTGKTLSACLLAKHCNCDVYRVDLSLIISKYIGETEKNLARIFDVAEHRRWILFFDEADALFGRRTRVSDAHDRFANQEISFLLQRIEEFSGVVILASNMKTNIDDAFLRRFHSVIHFPLPKPPERERIWKGAFSPQAHLEEVISLPRIATRYELSGGTIMNVVRYASLKALSRHESTIHLSDLEDGIRRELRKEGRML